MTNEQALNVIRQVLDAASKGGLFENMDASFLAAKSFNIISNAILEKDKNQILDADGIDS